MILSRCPSCGTTFRVTPEQLRARQGMVRCGRCSAAFNALDHLAPGFGHDTPRPTAPGGAAPLPEPPPEPPPPIPSPQPGTLAAFPAVAIDFPPLIGSGADEGAPAPARQEETPVAAEPEPPAPSAPEPAPLPEPEPASRSLAPADETAPEQDPAVIGEVAVAAPRRWPAVGLAAGIAALALLALAQLLFIFRQDAALAFPGSRPLLESWCAQLGCRIGLPRRAELVSIETSDLQPDSGRKGQLILGATIRNRADFAQDVPHLELTLTDARDRALARRVFAPADYLPAGGDARSGMGAGAELAVHLVIDASSIGASGYRLYVFYP